MTIVTGLFYGVLLFYSVYEFYTLPRKVIMLKDVIIAERRIFSTIIIPIKDIDEIKKELSKPFVSYDYFVKYGEKKLRLSAGYYRFNGNGFNKFIDELQRKVDDEKCK